jgi:hypothetical protein
MADEDKQQDEEPQKDEYGNEIDMSAHIPEGTEEAKLDPLDEDNELDMDAKLNDLDGGIHKTSVTFGTVYSEYETDGAGRGPEDFKGMGITDPDEVDAPELNSPATATATRKRSSKKS